MEILRERQDNEPYYTGECIKCKTIIRAVNWEVKKHTYSDPYGYSPDKTVPECNCPNCGLVITMKKEGGEE